ncbi:MAG: DNA-3-methyladenine glycosylase I [Gammaproteobacteria bacterium]|nr:DNA-3-methyladenine glycosylase I [Gammaproteobacteria bacterium]
MGSLTRCEWCGDDPLYQDYHDYEWGVPLHDNQKLFEFLCLEGAQAGLSWLTILRKRERYFQVFDGFDPDVIARYDAGKKAELMADPGIVRNRLKVDAFINNARATLSMREAGLTLDAFLWDFVDGRPMQNAWRTQDQVPAKTDLSDRLSRALKERTFTFVGPTICYSFMQATGMVNDHLVSCFRHAQIQEQAEQLTRQAIG